MTFLKTTLAAAVAAIVATSASATTYSYTDVSNSNGVQDATFTYQDTTDRFQMSFGNTNGNGVDGFWVVVNDGPQPYGQGKGHLAILYSDLTDVWAYQYTGAGVSGVNGSFNSPLIQKFTGAVSATLDGANTTYSMLLDMSGVNKANQLAGSMLPADWEGLQFDDKIGTWLHTTKNSFANCSGPVEVGDDLNCFNGSNWLGWDRAYQNTTIVPDSNLPPVPLPAAGWMLLASLGGLAAMRRRQS